MKIAIITGREEWGANDRRHKERRANREFPDIAKK